MMNILPVNCQHAASINYSILDNEFKPANIYRFFCISLYRDDWYYVRVTLDDIKKLTGDKSLSKFNDDFREYLKIKMYYLDTGYAHKTKRNIYHVPAMEKECITISKNFLLYELSTAVKGFFIQLMLLSQFSGMALNKQNIISALNMCKKTYDKYLIDLQIAKLVTNDRVLTLHTDGILLENDFSMQKKQSTYRLLRDEQLKINMKSIKP
jgi:hypothetical protein